jgi:hypothetical protein
MCQDLLAVEEDNERERAAERAEEARVRKEKEDWGALPEFLRQQIAPPKALILKSQCILTL